MYQATPKQYLMLNSWKRYAKLKLSWKKAFLIKKVCTVRHSLRKHGGKKSFFCVREVANWLRNSLLGDLAIKAVHGSDNKLW